ncbi:MAG: glycosyltransferase family 4 protein [Bacteroidales bacterium]|nr:glycosyltransferase family 4 protein [Bacteroidales bacterium]
MRILINGHAFQAPSTRHRGIGRYARTLCAGIAAVRPDWQLEFLEFDHIDAIDSADLPHGSQIVPYHSPAKLVFHSPEKMWEAGRHLEDWVSQNLPDIFLSISTFEGDAVLPPQAIDGVPHVIVIHDLIPMVYAPLVFSNDAWAGVYAERLQMMRDAALWLANSEATAQDVRRLVPHRQGAVTNIGGATDSHFTADEDPETDAALLRARGIHRPFLLVGGGDCWRKNMRGCVSGYARLPRTVREHYDLVIAGSYSANEQQRIQQLAVDLGVVFQVRQLGRVTDAELAALYRQCRVFLFPSLYEGLGLPIVEALLCGAPVVTASTSSMPEYAGPAAHYCDPLQPESIAHAIAAAIAEPAATRRAERIAYGYTHTPQTVGERACRAMEDLLAIPRKSRRPTLAWFAELRPPFGVPEADLPVLAQLAREYSIEIICQPNMTDLLLSLRVEYPIIPAQMFFARHAVMRYSGAVTTVAPDTPWLPDHALPEVFVRRATADVTSHRMPDHSGLRKHGA